MYSNELNNNFNYNSFNLNKKIVRKISDVSVSSLGSDLSDFNEDFGPSSGAILEKDGVPSKVTSDSPQQKLQRKRSNSLGSETTPNYPDDSNFEVFPSLPNSVLEKMGLFGDAPRERLSDDDIEQKFTSLSLAFSIDAATINDRYERQRRHRDLTENNLTIEIEKLKDKLALIQPLCTNFESAELLSILLAQVETIMRASSLVSNSAERYGAVQHEKRLTESVHLMVNHVQVLKQQRDSARRYLQYTKKFLQSSPETSNSPTNHQKSSMPANRKVIGRRRASIATISQPLLQENSINTCLESKKTITRRISDLSVRASTSLNRNVRPNRLELGLLGVDLVKIKEGFVDEPLENYEIVSEDDKPMDSPNDGATHDSLDLHPERNDELKNLENVSTLNKLKCRLDHAKEICKMNFTMWYDKNTILEFFTLCGVLCFAMSIVVIINIYVAIRQTKASSSSWFSLLRKNGQNVNNDVSKKLDVNKKK